MDKRDKWIHFRISQEKREQLKGLAEYHGYSTLSSFLNHVIEEWIRIKNNWERFLLYSKEVSKEEFHD